MGTTYLHVLFFIVKVTSITPIVATRVWRISCSVGIYLGSYMRSNESRKLQQVFLKSFNRCWSVLAVCITEACRFVLSVSEWRDFGAEPKNFSKRGFFTSFGLLLSSQKSIIIERFCISTDLLLWNSFGSTFHRMHSFNCWLSSFHQKRISS